MPPLTDAEFFNESARGIPFGNALSFTLTLTENFAGGSPDQFSFFLLNDAGTASLVSTSEPTGADALFAIDITGLPAGSPSVFSSQTQGVSYRVQLQSQQQVIPEPGTVVLLVCGLLPLLGLRLRRCRPPRLRTGRNNPHGAPCILYFRGRAHAPSSARPPRRITSGRSRRRRFHGDGRGRSRLTLSSTGRGRS